MTTHNPQILDVFDVLVKKRHELTLALVYPCAAYLDIAVDVFSPTPVAAMVELGAPKTLGTNELDCIREKRRKDVSLRKLELLHCVHCSPTLKRDIDVRVEKM